jgi:hypothetical protein
MQPNWRKLNPPYSSGLVGPRERILPTRNSQLFPPITNHQSFITVCVTPPVTSSLNEDGRARSRANVRSAIRNSRSAGNSSFLIQSRYQKKAPRISSGALLCCAEAALLNFNKLGIAGADHPFRIYEAVHVNCDPAVVHEHEVRVADQPEVVRPETLDEELFRMPPKTEHFAMTRLELLHVHLRGLIHVRLARRSIYVRLVRARTCPRLIPVYVRSTTLNVRLSTYVCARFRFCLRFALLLRGSGTHLLPFRRRCRLRFLLLRLPLRRLWLRLA